jgi:hypothetical protein
MSVAAACKVSRTPSEETSRASGEEVRSGRKQSSSTAVPRTMVKASVPTSATGVSTTVFSE